MKPTIIIIRRKRLKFSTKVEETLTFFFFDPGPIYKVCVQYPVSFSWTVNF